MRPLPYILCALLVVIGFGFTIWTWYLAWSRGLDNQVSAGAGPMFIALGAMYCSNLFSMNWLVRIAVRLSLFFCGVFLGYANMAAVKAAFPRAPLADNLFSY